MPEAHKLQAWLTIRGPDSGTLIQDHDSWLDLHEYEDVVIWHEVSDQSNVSGLTIETSPVADETMFVSVASLGIAVTTGPRITAVLLSSATVPLARYLRWKVTGRIGSSFSLTFRAWVVASRPQYGALLAMLANGPTSTAEGPELQWLMDGGDETLLDEQTRRNLSILEEVYGCNDGVVREVRAEMRRQAVMLRAERAHEANPSSAGRVRQTSRPFECDSVFTPSSDDHVPVD